ncbi:MAG: hypothetical protein ABI807_02810 [Sporichthyaceae bacterium]
MVRSGAEPPLLATATRTAAAMTAAASDTPATGSPFSTTVLAILRFGVA